MALLGICFYGKIFSPHLMKMVVWGREACPVKCGKLRVLGRIWVIQRSESGMEEELEDDSCASILKTSHTV